MEAPADSTWKGYSLAERDRRWNAVHRNAAEAGLDCVWVPLGNGLDAQYLTQMRLASVVLPTDATKPPIAVTDRGIGNSWVPETRSANRLWAPPMAQALVDAGMERARIGVVGLKGGKVTHVRAIDGVVNHTSYEDVVRKLPNATFEDATDVVGFARFVKSDEEIECLRHSALIAEAAVDEMIEMARPGVDAALLYARIMGRLLELGSQYYAAALKIGPIGGPEPYRHTSPPLGQRLQPNDLITNEICAIWGNQVAQEDQPVLLGPVPDDWKAVVDLQAEVFQAGLERMKPGTSFGEFIDFTNNFGNKTGGRLKTLVLLHGRGLGDDGPLLTPRARGEAIRDVRFEKGNAWVWKPYAMTADSRIEYVWGGDVVVTDNGGEVLFKRPPGMVSIS